MLAAILCTREGGIPLPVKHGGDDAGHWRKEKKRKKELKQYNSGIKEAIRKAYAEVTGEVPETLVADVAVQLPVFVARETNDGYDLQAQLHNAKVLIDGLIQIEVRKILAEQDDEEALLMLL